MSRQHDDARDLSRVPGDDAAPDESDVVVIEVTLEQFVATLEDRAAVPSNSTPASSRDWRPVQALARVKVTWVTPLGEEVASIS